MLEKARSLADMVLKRVGRGRDLAEKAVRLELRHICELGHASPATDGARDEGTEAAEAVVVRTAQQALEESGETQHRAVGPVGVQRAPLVQQVGRGLRRVQEDDGLAEQTSVDNSAWGKTYQIWDETIGHRSERTILFAPLREGLPFVLLRPTGYVA